MKIKKYDQQNKMYILLGALVLCMVTGINGMNLVSRRPTKMGLAAQKKQKVANLVKLVQIYFMDDAWKNLNEDALKDLVDQYKECMKYIDLKNNEQDQIVFAQALSNALHIPIEDINVPYEQMLDFEYSIFGNKLISLIEDYLINDRWKTLAPQGQQSFLEEYKECERFIPISNENEAQTAFNQKLTAKGVSEMEKLSYYRAMGRFESSPLYKNSK